MGSPAVGIRRSVRPTSLLILGAGLLALSALFASPPAEPGAFVAPPTASLRASRSRGLEGATRLRGFKEDFDAWKTSLTDDEKAQIQTQAEGEFNKKFRKSDLFSKDLPDEKVDAFSKILGKFFDAEAEDYKKEVEGKAPDYDGLLKKAAEGGMDFTLRESIVEIDRDADRRYQFASAEIAFAAEEGKKYPQSSPMMEPYWFRNNDTASNDYLKGIFATLKEAAKDSSCPPEMKTAIAELEKDGIPAVGEDFSLWLPRVMVNQADWVEQEITKQLDGLAQTKSEAEYKAEAAKAPEVGLEVIKVLSDQYVKARDEIEGKVDNLKKFYRSQKDMPGKTKADVLKELWAELPKYAEGPVPPLDDEMLAELAEEPASPKEELSHNWGTADKLYRSEAIDAFGQKYLLGIFETMDECHKAFKDWNAEYETARKSLKDEMAQWSKQEQAKNDADIEKQQNVKEIFAEAKM